MCFVVLVLGLGIGAKLGAAPVIAPEEFHVVLDAGHGGHDGGASVDGVNEAELNLQIVNVLAQTLRQRGCTVSLTRVDANSLNFPLAPNKKVDDMNKRREKIRQLNPDLVISIHLNAYPDRTVQGLQCFYANETPGSKDYATAIQEQFNASGLPIDKQVKPTDFNLVEHSPCPAVLIECGFLTNPREHQLLQLPTYQQILAYHITAGVLTARHKTQTVRIC
ncbi:MAG: N-acetylmuramoyl-L-alanine amidase [Eubacteriales bacterium]|nr:N-acetylmuramoyl-L-alanine amidase [Eubacteriales bacterium]